MDNEIEKLAERLRDLLGVDYVGHVTSTQLKLGRETLAAIIDKIERLESQRAKAIEELQVLNGEPVTYFENGAEYYA